MKPSAWMLLSACVLLLAGTGVRADDKPARPNVIFILADDMGYGDLGCYGQRKILTPNLDRMAGEGVRFTQAYSGTSVCAPSRCALMTGLHIGHAPIRANRELKPEGQFPLPANSYTVAKLFKSAGYKTAAFGKWGLGYVTSPGAPDKMGFDYFFGYNCQRLAHDYYPDHLWRNHERIALHGKTYSHDLISKEALQWIRANSASPFFAYIPFTIPHPNFQVPNLGPYADKSWPAVAKKYAAMITHMDSDIGRLFALLKELKIDEKTLIFYTSDNGADNETLLKVFHSNGCLRGTKRSMYEGAFREPSIARWPGVIKPGAVNPTQWAFYDFLPTMSKLINQPLPEGVKTDGISILPALLEGKTISREFLYWELHEPHYMQAVRMGDWKGVRPRPGAAIELYDLAKDIAESHNVAREQSEVVKKIEKIMQEQHVPDPNWSDGGGGKKTGGKNK